MIEINLLPEELKIKTKIRSPEQAVKSSPLVLLQEKLFFYAIALILGVLIIAHFYFAVLWVSKKAQLVASNRKWVNLAAQQKELAEFNQKFSSTSQYAGALQQLIRQRVLWAQKLNELSLNLPSGVWFNSILLNSNNLTIRGSVVSLEKDEVGLVNKLLDKLKSTPEFFKDFSSLELTKVQKKVVGGYEVADFDLVGVLKSK